MKQLTGAFSMIEVMIVVTIIGILAAAGIPMYQNYTKRARLSELVTATAPYKLGVTLCYQMLGDLSACDSSKHGIPAALKSGSQAGLIDKLTVRNGVITVTPKKQHGISKQDTFVLKPVIKNHQLSWKKMGGAIKSGMMS
ncbi:MAG: prepilin-type N-terminal cleavage/methylation domain-containing protein [Coxiellaceae bacterium]|nr:prepilin-type N-terminal cleavage/methylation domain-containing protein [Coxiellaceae bacterium]